MITPERLKCLKNLQHSLDYYFRDPLLLNKALTHRSYANENHNISYNNERFEYLGDCVLDLIVSDYTVKNYVNHSEGVLSKIRAAVVNEHRLAELAKKISLGDYLLLGKGEELSGGREKNSLLANTFEAIAGAVYFDAGQKTAHAIFLPLLEENIKIFAETSEFRDYKSELQEFTQNKLSCVPSYKVEKEVGPDHEKTFHVAVLIRQRKSGMGKGRTKKEAEQAAAKSALVKIEPISTS
tara:strand:+ start:270 stop:986 length:717 start_codon:yes stop_codon:yes gene_type:complete